MLYQYVPGKASRTIRKTVLILQQPCLAGFSRLARLGSAMYEGVNIYLSLVYVQDAAVNGICGTYVVSKSVYDFKIED